MLNDAFRLLIHIFIGVAAQAFRALLFFRIRFYAWTQERLRRKYRIVSDTPILGYVGQRFRDFGTPAVVAYTSGSTKEPRGIPYNGKRIFRTQFVFVNALWRSLAATPLVNRTIFVFSSMADAYSPFKAPLRSRS